MILASQKTMHLQPAREWKTARAVTHQITERRVGEKNCQRVKPAMSAGHDCMNVKPDLPPSLDLQTDGAAIGPQGEHAGGGQRIARRRGVVPVGIDAEQL